VFRHETAAGPTRFRFLNCLGAQPLIRLSDNCAQVRTTERGDYAAGLWLSVALIHFSGILQRSPPSQIFLLERCDQSPYEASKTATAKTGLSGFFHRTIAL
jgi:hypothetical protein